MTMPESTDPMERIVISRARQARMAEREGYDYHRSVGHRFGDAAAVRQALDAYQVTRQSLNASSGTATLSIAIGAAVPMTVADLIEVAHSDACPCDLGLFGVCGGESDCEDIPLAWNRAWNALMAGDFEFGVPLHDRPEVEIEECQ